MNNTSDSSSIGLEIEGPIARVTLRRPELHNALEVVDVDRFRSHLDEVGASEAIRVLVITGSGSSTFCSGASLRQMESGEMSGEIFDTLTDRVASVRVPTICSLNGSVYGGGAEIALCCDFRVGVMGSRLSVPAAQLGVCYPVGGLRRYVERLGLAASSRVLLASEGLDSDEMLRLGFLTHLVEPHDLRTATHTLATKLASLAPLAVQGMKRIMLDIVAGEVDATAAARLIARCADSNDLKEGFAARRENRTPRFEGR